MDATKYSGEAKAEAAYRKLSDEQKKILKDRFKAFKFAENEVPEHLRADLYSYLRKLEKDFDRLRRKRNKTAETYTQMQALLDKAEIIKNPYIVKKPIEE